MRIMAGEGVTDCSDSGHCSFWINHPFWRCLSRLVVIELQGSMRVRIREAEESLGIITMVDLVPLEHRRDIMLDFACHDEARGDCSI